MFCNFCGKKINDIARFCPYCGMEVVKISPFKGDLVQSTSVSDHKEQQESVKAKPVQPEPVQKKDPSDVEAYTEDVENALTVYLDDIVSMEFSIRKLSEELLRARNIIARHDYWIFRKEYELPEDLDLGFWKGKQNAPCKKIIFTYCNGGNEENRNYRMIFFGYWSEWFQQLLSKKEMTGEPVMCLHGDQREFEEYYEKLFDGYVNNDWIGEYLEGKILDIDSNIKKNLLMLPVKEEIIEKKGVFKSSFSKQTVYTESVTFWNNFWHTFGKTFDMAGGSLLTYYKNVIETIKNSLEDFDLTVKNRETQYHEGLPALEKQIEYLHTEIDKAKGILQSLYNVDIIPPDYRNLGCMYSARKYFATSKGLLSDALLRLDVNDIRDRLDSIFQMNLSDILVQAKTEAANPELRGRKDRLFEGLSNMTDDINNKMSTICNISISTPKWKQLADLNKTASNWIGNVKYLD